MSFAPKITQRRARYLPRGEEKSDSSSKLRAGGKATQQSDDVESTVSSTPNNSYTRDGKVLPLQSHNRMRDSEVSSTMSSLLGIQPLPASHSSPPATPFMGQHMDVGEKGVLEAEWHNDRAASGMACLADDEMKGRVGELAAILLASSPGSGIVMEMIQPFVFQSQTSLEVTFLLFSALHQYQQARDARLRRAAAKLALTAATMCSLLLFVALILMAIISAAQQPPPV